MGLVHRAYHLQLEQFRGQLSLFVPHFPNVVCEVLFDLVRFCVVDELCILVLKLLVFVFDLVQPLGEVVADSLVVSIPLRSVVYLLFYLLFIVLVGRICLVDLVFQSFACRLVPKDGGFVVFDLIQLLCELFVHEKLPVTQFADCAAFSAQLGCRVNR